MRGVIQKLYNMVSLSLSPWASITDNSLPLLTGLDCKFVESPAGGFCFRFLSAPQSTYSGVPCLYFQGLLSNHQTRNTKRLSVHLSREILIHLKPTLKNHCQAIFCLSSYPCFLVDFEKRLQSRCNSPGSSHSLYDIRSTGYHSRHWFCPSKPFRRNYKWRDSGLLFIFWEAPGIRIFMNTHTFGLWWLYQSHHPISPRNNRTGNPVLWLNLDRYPLSGSEAVPGLVCNMVGKWHN